MNKPSDVQITGMFALVARSPRNADLSLFGIASGEPLDGPIKLTLECCGPLVHVHLDRREDIPKESIQCPHGNYFVKYEEPQ